VECSSRFRNENDTPALFAKLRELGLGEPILPDKDGK
jgi:hypothetical protein